jgi:thioredoxin 1
MARPVTRECQGRAVRFINTTFTESLGADMGAATKTVTDATFDTEVLGSDKPVLVDFWAEWCGPCKMVAPVLEEIALENAEKITIAKVNIDENPEIARRYQIMSIPTMSVFAKGEVVKSIVGAKPKAALLRDLEGIL